MWNLELLEAAAQSHRVVVLKRGLGASTEEWISTALRLFAYGASNVILCERGMPSYGWPSRNVVDLSTLIFLASESPLPVWFDVSHSAGERSVVVAMLRHARALPIDAVMVEVHPDPDQSTCDAAQAIDCTDLQSAWER
jgi:3-deoxy-7-phosphoheptulonate synthase/chorismate mutase